MTITVPTPSTGLTAEQAAARESVYSTPLDRLDPGDPAGFSRQEMWWKFERLRAESPVHYTAEEHTEQGPYWSLTKWDDIMAADTDHETFSAQAGIVLRKPPEGEIETDIDYKASALTGELGAGPGQGASTAGTAEAAEAAEAARVRERNTIRSLLSMDPPEHEVHRSAVVDGVSPANLRSMEPLIRERAGAILDALPIGEEFDFVEHVSRDLTAMTLATLFDFPQEERKKLTHWSDVMTSVPGPDSIVKTQEEFDAQVQEFFQVFAGMFQQRAQEEKRVDFVSLLAHSPHAKDFTFAELQGDGIVLLVGGNDTTRNTISGSVYALNKFPAEYDKLRANPKLIPSMVSETIRWQTPLTHMMRVATRDVEIGGRTIRAGDRVALWYVSGNRDEDKIENPYDYVIDRKNPRQHLSFGFGIHRCLGNRLAELQLRIIWEEMLARFPRIEVVGEPAFSHNNFVKGYDSMTVVIPEKN
ncbi:cytochrome P450 [Brevibacterium litoralis]|uniref:cytochrome P450 n=1 Tax=Brevibacterium litoralis TaxID=3138935 RepID=UPI0032EC84B1